MKPFGKRIRGGLLMAREPKKPSHSRMAAKRENSVKARIRVLLNTYDKRLFWYAAGAGPYQRKGLPDFCLCVLGKYIGVEAKSSVGRLTRLQEHTHQQIRAAGGEVFLVKCPESLHRLKAYLDDALGVAGGT